MSEFKVVVLSARAGNLVACVRSVMECEPDLPPADVIVVDDGARAEAERHLPGITWVAGAKPFVFARNANLGIAAAGVDVVLLNDDARLVTPGGFSRLCAAARARPDIGLCSAAIQGIVGNPRQHPHGAGGEIRTEPDVLAFVGVLIPWRTCQAIGPLDDRFVGYGFEDNDYCERVRGAGLGLGICDACVIDHGGDLPSTFRTRPDIADRYEVNRRLYEQKQRDGLREPGRHTVEPPGRVDSPLLLRPSNAGGIDVLYLAFNRLEFTRETFPLLLENTDWDLVNELFVIDDGSIDGTCEWLEKAARSAPARVRFLKTAFGSPVEAMAHFIEAAGAPLLAKIDNDTMVPPRWLREAAAVMRAQPGIDMLGIEALRPHDAKAVRRSCSPSPCISGLGLYRRASFTRSRPHACDRWHGFEEWQVAQQPPLGIGWIDPAMPIFLLDRCPFEPWASLTREYVHRGWQRAWQGYDPRDTLWHWRWPPQVTVGPPLPPGYPGVGGAMRIRNEAPHISEVLRRALALCEQVFVLDDHSDDGTRQICEAFGSRVVVVPSPFEGLDESRDKNYLLERLVVAPPRWVLWIDGDELLERTGPERLAAAAASAPSHVASYALRIAYVWDHQDRVRVDGTFGTFARPSFFRLEGQPLQRLRFPETRQGANFHCGNVPGGLEGTTEWLEVRLKHLGYVTPEQRLAKYRWYTSIDPDNPMEDNYRHLIDVPGARHAPGPPQLIPWTE